MWGPEMFTAEVQLATFTTNKKHKREVCRYWLSSRCAKGSECEFLHTLDYEKMPVCSLGDACPDKSSCNYKHMDEHRPVCSNYQIGFCSFGRRCPHRHVELEAHELKDLSVYWPRVEKEEYSAALRLLPKGPKGCSKGSFRTKPCEYFLKNKWCPYFDMCNFMH